MTDCSFVLDFIARNPGLDSEHITFRLGVDNSCIEELALQKLIFFKDGWRIASYTREEILS